MKGKEATFNVSDIMRRRLTITGSTLRNRDPAFKAQLAAEIKKKCMAFDRRQSDKTCYLVSERKLIIYSISITCG